VCHAPANAKHKSPLVVVGRLSLQASERNGIEDGQGSMLSQRVGQRRYFSQPLASHAAIPNRYVCTSTNHVHLMRGCTSLNDFLAAQSLFINNCVESLDLLKQFSSLYNIIQGLNRLMPAILFSMWRSISITSAFEDIHSYPARTLHST